MKESSSDRIVHNVIVFILSIFSIAMIFPLYYVIVVSFTDAAYYNKMNGMVFLPLHPSLKAYKYLLSTKTIISALKISLYLTVAGTFLSVLVNAGISYAISRKRLRGRSIIMFAILITMLFSPGIIPNFINVKNLGLMNNLFALILPVLTSGFYVILMRGFYDNIPISLEEAASIDGCNDITIFFKIILPLSLPSIAAFSLFYAVGYWNTYLSAVFYINNPNLYPLQVVVMNLINSATSSLSPEAASEMSVSQMPSDMLKMAAVVISVIPILMVYPFLQKHFSKGVMLGSIKE